MARKKPRYKFRILKGLYVNEGVHYGPSVVDDKGNEVQTENGGNVIETDLDLVTLRNVPGGPAKYLLIEDRGVSPGPEEPDFDSMDLRALKTWAKKQEPPIDVSEASSADEARHIIQLCLDTA
jgi:hypothetical protein